VTSCSVLIPVLGRPERVAVTVASLAASLGLIPADPVFVCSPEDIVEISAVIAAGHVPLIARFACGPGDYARKMNLGFDATGTDWVFLAADDLNFHQGWLDRAVMRHQRTGACVIGTNDLGNSRTIAGYHSTHTLVHRDYLGCGGTADDPTRLLHEGYDHQFVDDEFVQTAISRGTYAHAQDSIVEHLHPDWGKGTRDATYEKGAAGFTRDRALYNERRQLWRGTPR
jgi:hypothetical protein